MVSGNLTKRLLNKITTNSSSTTTVLTKTMPQDAMSLKRKVHYHVDRTDATTTSKEHAEKNPLLKKLYSKKVTDNSYQHPSIGRIICEKPQCPQKICNEPCTYEIKEKTYVAHVTHTAYPGSVFLSYTDFNEQQKAQYGMFYEKAIPNNDCEGKNENKNQTKILNEKNELARDLIHIHSSKTPIDDEIF